MNRDLSLFTGAGYDIGRGRAVQALWLLTQSSIFMRWWCPARLRVLILRLFGATIGNGVLIRHRVRIHWPWKLHVGENSWIGEGAWLLNLELITIGANVCISQEVLLCTGSHDRRSPAFEFDNAPIHIHDGSWLATRSVVLRGVSIGRGATVSAMTVVKESIPPDSVIGR